MPTMFPQVCPGCIGFAESCVMDDADLCKIRRSLRQGNLFVRLALRSSATLDHKVQCRLKNLVNTKDTRQGYIASMYVSSLVLTPEQVRLTS